MQSVAKAVGKMRGEDSAQAGAAEKRSKMIRMRRASCAAALPDPAQRLSDHLFHKEVPPTASQRQKLLERKLDDIMSGRPSSGAGELTRVQSVAECRPSTPTMVDALYRKERKEIAGQIVGRISKPADLWKREEVSGESDNMTPTRTRSTSSVASFSRATSSTTSEPWDGDQLVRGVHSLRRLSAENSAPPDADDGGASPPPVSPGHRSRQRRGSALMDALITISRAGPSGNIQLCLRLFGRTILVRPGSLTSPQPS